MKTHEGKKALEKKSERRVSESGFDESYSRLTKFLRSKPTPEKLKKFMKENPGTVIYVPKAKVEAGHKKFMDDMKKDPIGRRILDANRVLMQQVGEE